MYCRNCGSPNPPQSVQCVRCGAPLFVPPQPVAPLQYASMPPVRVPSYLAQAILITLFCCMPCGIVAIIYAAQVNARAQLGDITGAINFSNKARAWCWAGFIATLLLFGIGFLFSILSELA